MSLANHDGVWIRTHFFCFVFTPTLPSPNLDILYACVDEFGRNHRSHSMECIFVFYNVPGKARHWLVPYDPMHRFRCKSVRYTWLACGHYDIKTALAASRCCYGVLAYLPVPPGPFRRLCGEGNEFCCNRTHPPDA